MVEIYTLYVVMVVTIYATIYMVMVVIDLWENIAYMYMYNVYSC